MKTTKKLIKNIILAQGNIFIKELLRENNIKIGTTKKDFGKNLFKAIEEGKLTTSQILSWMNEVEGWGDQHIYLFHLPASKGREFGLHDADIVKSHAVRAGLQGLVGNKPSKKFTSKREFTGIYCSNEAFGLVWHQGFQTWVRMSSKDIKRKEGNDNYEYRAYREFGKRSVMRFEWPIGKNYAAIFLQIPAAKTDHSVAIKEVWKALGHFKGSPEPLKPFNLNLVVKKLDKNKPILGKTSSIAAEETKYMASGGDITFRSSNPEYDYKRDAVIGQVHRAVQPDNFSGSSGRFLFRPSNSLELSRDLKLQFYSAENRIRVWVQCKKTDMWNVLDYISSI